MDRTAKEDTPSPPPAAAAPPSGGRVPAAAAVLAGLAVLALSLWQAELLHRFYQEHARLPLWDMAGHGLQGQELAADLRSGHLLRFFLHLIAQDSWPFGFSLLLVPFLLAGQLFGVSGFAAATLLSTVCYALTGLALLWAAREVEGGMAGVWAGLLAAALFVSSPFYRLYAILIMREEAGALVALLAFCLYLRASRRATLGAWRAAGLAALALVFIKYNYGFIWLVTATALSVGHLERAGRRKLLAWLLALVRPWRGPDGRPRWWRIIPLAYLAGVAVIFIGWRELAGSVLYPAIVVGAVIVLVRWRRSPAQTARRLRELPPMLRGAVETIVMPLWLWNLFPDHTRSIFASLVGHRSSGLPPWSPAALLAYPRALVEEYAVDPLIGVIILLLIAASLAWWRRGGTLRDLQATALLGLAMVSLHPHKQERFLATVATFALLAGAIAFTRLAYALPPRRWRPIMGGLLALAALMAVLLPLNGPRLAGMLTTGYALESTDPSIEPCLAWFILEADPTKRTAVIGSFNEFSANLIVWRVRQGPPPVDLNQVPLMDPLGGDLRPETVRDAVREWVERDRPEQVLAVRLPPDNPWYRSEDYRVWNAWQLRVIDVLEADPSWEVKARRRFETPRLELMVLRRKG